MFLSKPIPHSLLVRQTDHALWMVDISNVHPLASGNKFYKLNLNIEFAKQQGIQQLLSFGGAYSNHIHALALYAKSHKMASVGIIRGEEEYASNPTLTDAQKAGMQLEFVSRKDYRLRHDPDYLASLQARYPDTLILPEGGSNALAVEGCKLLAEQVNQCLPIKPDIVTVACGTGGTCAGIIAGLDHKQSVIGFSVLKDKSLKSRVDGFLQQAQCTHPSYQIEQADYGGYARFDGELLDFILGWLDDTGILLDPIYTSKMCKRLMEVLEQGQIESGANIAIIHSGGLQAWRGMKEKVIALQGEGVWQRINSFL